MKQSHATVLGFLAAPLVPSVVMLFVAFCVSPGDPGVAGPLLASLFAYLPALVITLMTASPAFLLMRRARGNWLVAIATGTAIGAMVGEFPFLGVAWGAGTGAGEALVFWLVWWCGNPPRRRDLARRAA